MKSTLTLLVTERLVTAAVDMQNTAFVRSHVVMYTRIRLAIIHVVSDE